MRMTYTRLYEIHQTFCRESEHSFYNVRSDSARLVPGPTERLGSRLSIRAVLTHDHTAFLPRKRTEGGGEAPPYRGVWHKRAVPLKSLSGELADLLLVLLSTQS